MLDELDRVRAFGADTPEPDDGTVLAARADLIAAIRRPPARSAPRRLRRRRLAVVTAAACTALAVTGILGIHGAADPQSAYAAEMNHLAAIAASRAWTGIPRPGQYLYTASVGPSETDSIADSKECRVVYYERRESWIATDGSGALKQTSSHARFTSRADRRVCAQMNITNPASQNLHVASTLQPGSLSFITHHWNQYSVDPARLLKQIHATVGETNLSPIGNIADFLRESDAPAAIRSALYRAAALIPGVKLLGLVRDPVGRTGLGISADGTTLIIDRQTARLMAEENRGATGKLVGWTAYLQSKIVDSHPPFPREK